MKEITVLTFFLIIILIISSVAVIFVTQNSQIISIKFFQLIFPEATIGVVGVLAFFAGVVFTWVLLLVIYFSTISRFRKKIRDLIKEKETLEAEINGIKKQAQKENPQGNSLESKGKV